MSPAPACGQRGHCRGGGRAALAQPPRTKLPAVGEPSPPALGPPGLPPPPGPSLSSLPPTLDNAPHSCPVPVTSALGPLNGEAPLLVPHLPGDRSIAPLRGGKCPGPLSAEMPLGGARPGRPGSPREPGAPGAVYFYPLSHNPQKLLPPISRVERKCPRPQAGPDLPVCVPKIRGLGASVWASVRALPPACQAAGP